MGRHRSARSAVVVLALTLVLASGAVAAGQTLGASNRCASGQTAPGGDICVTRGNAQATQILDAVRELKQNNPIRGLIFGVWVDGKSVLTGAMGEALPGVPATRRDNLRFGNVAETMMTTILLKMVEDGSVSLDDPVAKFFPDLPEADTVTLSMLATSTSGYADFVTSTEFTTAFAADPFRQWVPAELIGIAMAQPTVFPPGTSWAFSDTNFVLLGEILAKASGKPYGKLVQSMILDKVGLADTRHTTSAAIPDPVMNAYSNERGRYEETTYWSPSWVTNAGTLTSNLADMGKWASALGKGTLLSKRSHERQVGDENVGLGTNTADVHYGMGVGINHEWIVANPQIDGYTGIVSYLPSKKTAVVVGATFTAEGDIGTQYAALIFNGIAAMISPDNAPNLTVCPRGC